MSRKRRDFEAEINAAFEAKNLGRMTDLAYELAELVTSHMNEKAARQAKYRGKLKKSDVTPEPALRHAEQSVASPEATSVASLFETSGVTTELTPSISTNQRDMSPMSPVIRTAVDVAVAVAVKSSSSAAKPKGNIAEILPDAIQQLAGKVHEHVTATPLDSHYSAERSRAGIAWGKDPRNADQYRRILDRCNAAAVVPISTAAGERLRNSAVIDACATASGFPSLSVWLTARAEG